MDWVTGAFVGIIIAMLWDIRKLLVQIRDKLDGTEPEGDT